MEECTTYRRLLVHRLDRYLEGNGNENKYHSPLFDIFKVTQMFGMLGMAVSMLNGTHFFSKNAWKRNVWSNAWIVDNEEWKYTVALFSDTHYLNMTLPYTENYLIWRDVSNKYPDKMSMCENMAKLICRCSNLKSDCATFKGSSHSTGACDNCDLFQDENLEHMVMQCANNADIRSKMSDDIDLLIENTGNIRLLSEVQLPSLLGRYIEGMDMDVMTDMWVIAGTAINEMYNRTEKAKVRAGIG